MKNIKGFLKKHTAVLLLLAVVLTMSVGTLWAKYAMDVKVTNSLSLTVEAKEEYVIDKREMWSVLKSLTTAPTTLKFVKDSEVPSGLTRLGNVEADGSGEIGVYMDSTTVYIAPVNPKDRTSVMYAPADSSNFLYADSSYAGGNVADLTSIDCSNLDTSRVTSMRWMFYYLRNLTELNLGSHFDTSKVTDMSGIFEGCKGLTALDVSGFNTANVTQMTSMFDGCSNLTQLDVSRFDTSKVTKMQYMFYNCKGLTSLNLTQFNTSCVVDTRKMFYGCSGLAELDLSSFDTSSVTYMESMFDGCTALATVTLGKNFNFVGTNGYLPTPDSTKITGADGNWRELITGTAYVPETLATYHNSQSETKTYQATQYLGWAPEHIRIRINVYSQNENGAWVPTSGVPVNVRRIIPNGWITAGWNDLVTLFSGTSDSNGVVYIDKTYGWRQDADGKAVWLGDGTNTDDYVFFHANSTMRFDINPADDSGYELNMEDYKIREIVTWYNGGPWEFTTGAGYHYDDFEFHGGIAQGNGTKANQGGAYIEYNLYVKETQSQSNAVESFSKSAALDFSGLENIDAAPAAGITGEED